MSLRENSKGLEERQHLQPEIVVDPPSSDEADGGPEGRVHPSAKGGGGNDSDPPIENDNPDDGDECFDPTIPSTGGPDGNNKELAKQRRAAQVHHRKRRKSSHSDANYIPPYKKNRFFRRQPSVLPSKFLLGGNIRDPLNLASLSDARISAELNQVTPQSSPLPLHGEVPVYIPKNPNDPLGLTTRTPENVEDMIAGVRKNSCSRKHRHRKRPGRKRTDSECSIGTECMEEAEDEKIEEGQGRIRRISDSQQIVNVSNNRKRKRSSSNPEVQINFEGDVEDIPEAKPEVVQVPKKVPQIQKEIVNVPHPPETVNQVENIKENKKEPAESVVESKTITEEPAPSTSKQTNKSEEVLAIDDSSKDVPTPQSYPSSASDYIPMSSSTYAPSPFAFDSTEYFLEAPPYESPNFAPFMYTPTHHMQPFSPPPLPEIPHFQQRMQMFPSRSPHLSLQRAVFHRPYQRKRAKPRHRADPIVSPVIPQPGSRRNNRHHPKKPENKTNNPSTQPSTSTSGDVTDNKSGEEEGKKYRAKDVVFQFGNYSHYYGYRTADQGDSRLWALKKEYFSGKDVLDVGCNSGHVTLSIARDYEPRRIHGIDIDFSLIVAARKNIRHFLVRDPENKDVVFPKSLPIVYGAIEPPPSMTLGGTGGGKPFPYNVSFAHENYVLNSDSLLDNVKPEYDVITCFSVTKWIHLNFGDEGLKRFFKRVFLHLKDDGIFILEPQPWNSYGKKKKLTEKIHQMYQTIRFYPDQFGSYLLTEVGFSTVESLGTPVHNSKGFQRPLLLFRKCSGAMFHDYDDNSHQEQEIEDSRSPFEVTSTCPPAAGDSIREDNESEEIVSSSSGPR